MTNRIFKVEGNMAKVVLELVYVIMWTHECTRRGGFEYLITFTKITLDMDRIIRCTINQSALINLSSTRAKQKNDKEMYQLAMI